MAVTVWMKEQIIAETPFFLTFYTPALPHGVTLIHDFWALGRFRDSPTHPIILNTWHSTIYNNDFDNNNNVVPAHTINIHVYVFM